MVGSDGVPLFWPKPHIASAISDLNSAVQGGQSGQSMIKHAGLVPWVSNTANFRDL
jgi:hypothetical protein